MLEQEDPDPEQLKPVQLEDIAQQVSGQPVAVADSEQEAEFSSKSS